MLPYQIIIADDDRAIRALLARTIVRLYPSVQITAVEDGADALHEWQQHGAQLLITDHIMPNLTGLDLIRLIRPQAPTLPILLITSLPDVAVDALAVGATEALVKPVSVATLRAVLRRLLPLTP